MSNYHSNKELFIHLSENENVIFRSSPLPETMPLVCKYIKPESSKLIDSTILRDISFITLDNSIVNIDNLFKYKRKNSCDVVYNIFDSLDTLHALAFNNCYTLYSCIIPENIKKLEEGIFYGCNNLNYVSLPETIEEICENVFNGCVNLKKIDNTENITRLHQYAFAGCGIKSIELNTSISSLLPYLFKNCYNLEKFESDSVEYLGEGVFSGCINLESVNVNYQGIAEINEQDYKEPLTEQEEPSSESNPGSEESGDDIGEDAEYDIDENITGCNVLPDMIFANCRKLTHDKISFIDNIQEIGYGSMMGCSSFDHFDRMLTKVGSYGFKDCINLISVKLNKCTEIKKYAFKNCISLQEVNLHDLNPELQIGVFEDCESLRKVGVNSINIIGEKSFKNCINLDDYYNLSNLTRVENQGFYNCKKLTVTEENNLNNINYIGDFGFCKCESLNNIILNDNVVLGNGAFKDCIGLTHIELPESITKLSNQTFNNCYSLETIEFKSDNLSSDFNLDAFDGCDNIKKIIIKEGNTYFNSINDEAVFDEQLNKLIYVAKNIGKFEFTQKLENCTIDPQAFNGCHLTLIDMSEINAPTIETNVFKNIDNDQWFIFMKKNDPNYRQYIKLVGSSHIKVCKY